MNTNTSTFYENLGSFSEFREFPNPKWYQPLPNDWCVVVTDVQGSTKAIEEGRYKEVNAVGVASIVALLNVLKPLKIPYVFGGDGATFCFPQDRLSDITPALAAVEKMSQIQFQLTLRVGLVKMEEIRSGGEDVLVAKYQPSPHFEQAMFSGGGLGFAEKIIKKDPQDRHRLIAESTPHDEKLFQGFECRWNEIPSPRGENLTLLVQALSHNNLEKEKVYSEILNAISQVYGEENQYHPLREDLMHLTSSLKLLSIEARIRNAFSSTWPKWKYFLKMQIQRLLGIWLMARGIKTENTDWGQYKKQFILNTDYRKFDEMLRMVISGSIDQRQTLRTILEQFKNQNKIVFGLHSSPSSLITCIVNDYNKNHIHFMDGANGGYAMAAKELKQQLKLAHS